MLLALLLAACSPRPTPMSNLVFVTLDTTRADHLGLYGYFRDTSPMLDAFARQAIVFDRAITPMATTLPSHTSLFTGTNPLEHGVTANETQGGSRFVPTPQLRSLAEIASVSGWRTAAFVSAMVVKRGCGLEDGFAVYDQPSGPKRGSEETVQAALDWLARTPELPFLLWVHVYDAHRPFRTAPPYTAMFSDDTALESWLSARHVPPTIDVPLLGESESTRDATDLYDGELRRQDVQVGRLLAALEARPDWGRTAVVVVGDHGEGLGQNGEAGHGGTWDAQLHVPLVIRIPGEAPRHVAMTVSTVDVLPTLLDHLNVPGLTPLRSQLSGRDVLASGAGPLPVLSQDTDRTRGQGIYREALTDDRWKYFHVEESEEDTTGIYSTLYDLSQDPYELFSVAILHPDIVAARSESLREMKAAQRKKGKALRGDAAPPSKAQPDAETVDQLRSLGYVDEPSSPTIK